MGKISTNSVRHLTGWSVRNKGTKPRVGTILVDRTRTNVVLQEPHHLRIRKRSAHGDQGDGMARQGVVHCLGSEGATHGTKGVANLG